MLASDRRGSKVTPEVERLVLSLFLEWILWIFFFALLWDGQPWEFPELGQTWLKELTQASEPLTSELNPQSNHHIQHPSVRKVHRKRRKHFNRAKLNRQSGT